MNTISNTLISQILVAKPLSLPKANNINQQTNNNQR